MKILINSGSKFKNFKVDGLSTNPFPDSPLSTYSIKSCLLKICHIAIVGGNLFTLRGRFQPVGLPRRRVGPYGPEATKNTKRP